MSSDSPSEIPASPEPQKPTASAAPPDAPGAKPSHPAYTDYVAECEKYGIDRRLGPLDQLAYALEVVTRMGPNVPDYDTDR